MTKVKVQRLRKFPALATEKFGVIPHHFGVSCRGYNAVRFLKYFLRRQTSIRANKDFWTEQWSNWGGTRVNGVPLPFLAGERRSPSLHDRCGWMQKTAFSRSMTATYNTSNRKMCVKCM